MERLSQERILVELSAEARALLGEFLIFNEIDSTNAYLLAEAERGLAGGSVCMAEMQTAGRGRRGRAWQSPPVANLYLSLLWRFACEPARLTALSLATGTAVGRALHRLGAVEVRLKWPNDLIWRGRKLGGILLESRGDPTGPCFVVAGIGLNIAMPAASAAAIDQPWSDLQTVLAPALVSRNHAAAQVLNELLPAFARFATLGWPAFAGDWRRFDWIAGQRVTVKLPQGDVHGTARGVDEHGALLLETASGLRAFAAGEISVRLGA
ncbi:MAG: biotin--[acetyl-CoA-carboxylase] ligase [Gammaproteobacteria bacterium]